MTKNVQFELKNLFLIAKNKRACYNKVGKIFRRII